MRLCTILACLVPALAQTTFDSASVERGRSQFKSSCGFCHGEDATGNRAPDLIRSTSLSHDTNGETLAPIIKNGRPDKGMPGFATLTGAQIADVVIFLHKQAYDALHSNKVPADYPLAKLLTGNADQGKAYFNGAGGCSKCHSPSGDLRGVAAKYSPLELQQRMLYPPKNPGRIAIVKTSSETIEGKLVHADEFEVSLTDKSGWYRSFPRASVQVEIRDPLAAHKAQMPKYTDADVHNLFAYLETFK